MSRRNATEAAGPGTWDGHKDIHTWVTPEMYRAIDEARERLRMSQGAIIRAALAAWLLAHHAERET